MLTNASISQTTKPARRRLREFLSPLAVLAGAAILFGVPNASQAQRMDGALLGQPATALKTWDIDKVWTGVPVEFSAVRAGDEVMAGYFDQSRQLSVAVLPLNGGSATHIRLQDTFKGWDGHNFVVLAVDRAGTIHVAGNMHGDPLKYFQVRKPYSSRTEKASPMVGADESSVTYPNFYYMDDGNLVFGYREGKTGDGAWFFNKWTGTAWVRLSPGPTFSSRFSGESVNAYPRSAKANDGTFHFALQWRKPGGLSENFRITYARTKDFVRWSRLDGSPIELPLTPENTSVVVDAGTEMGLRSGPISVDDRGRPVISFTRYAPDGLNAGYVARGDASGAWLTEEIARTSRRWVMEGRGIGTRAIAVGSKAVIFRDGTPIACFRIRGRGLECQMLDAQTLKPVKAVTLEADTRPRAAAASSDGLAEPSVHEVAVLDASGEETEASLVWPTQSARRWRCTRETPNACNPPAKMLRLVAPANWAADGR
ncbi:BNR repeat-containing protein [Reyranella sp.]|uniref:BNR repeat-containing protein n=1 Tax=Reyranella sp. TaxID=1929291 RepID=UPI003BABEB05